MTWCGAVMTHDGLHGSRFCLLRQSSHLHTGIVCACLHPVNQCSRA
jgi:hypothetical protein